MVEMTETNQAISNATKNSLLLFDEIGRGTATYDGMALAEAIIEHVHDKVGAKTLFSTHYHELTVLEERLEHLENVHVGAVEEDGNLVFLHKITSGSADKSYGVQVAKLAGLPETVLTRASAILTELEKKNEVPVYDQLANVEEAQETEVQKAEVHEPEMEDISQMSLFNGGWTETEDAVLEELKKIDVLNLTPLEAMNALNELKNKLKEN